MNLHIEPSSTPQGPIRGEQCPYCNGPVMPVTSRKHRRSRCAVCGADVPPAWLHGSSPRVASGRDDDRSVPRHAKGRAQSLRPSLARGCLTRPGPADALA